MTARTMSPAEAAAQIGGIKPRWLLDKAGLGLIPHTRIGNRIRFTQEDVDAIVEAGRRKPVDLRGDRPTARSRARRAS